MGVRRLSGRDAERERLCGRAAKREWGLRASMSSVPAYSDAAVAHVSFGRYIDSVHGKWHCAVPMQDASPVGFLAVPSARPPASEVSNRPPSSGAWTHTTRDVRGHLPNQYSEYPRPVLSPSARCVPRRAARGRAVPSEDAAAQGRTACVLCCTMRWRLRAARRRAGGGGPVPCRAGGGGPVP